MDQAKTGFRDMGFDDSKVEAISAQLGVSLPADLQLSQ
jgi:hypothetical protein